MQCSIITRNPHQWFLATLSEESTGITEEHECFDVHSIFEDDHLTGWVHGTIKLNPLGEEEQFLNQKPRPFAIKWSQVERVIPLEDCWLPECHRIGRHYRGREDHQFTDEEIAEMAAAAEIKET